MYTKYIRNILHGANFEKYDKYKYKTYKSYLKEATTKKRHVKTYRIIKLKNIFSLYEITDSRVSGKSKNNQ